MHMPEALYCHLNRMLKAYKFRYFVSLWCRFASLSSVYCTETLYNPNSLNLCVNLQYNKKKYLFALTLNQVR